MCRISPPVGNHIYEAEICQVLEGVKYDIKRAAYIRMDKIQPVHNYILGRGTLLKLSTCICELGTFVAYVRSSHNMVLNECAEDQE
uniref:Uncharacterized protein n=1 Tax=Hucho hucho TaxID=62062 RepID=A0A4W5R116_9TELE